MSVSPKPRRSPRAAPVPAPSAATTPAPAPVRKPFPVPFVANEFVYLLTPVKVLTVLNPRAIKVVSEFINRTVEPNELRRAAELGL